MAKTPSPFAEITSPPALLGDFRRESDGTFVVLFWPQDEEESQALARRCGWEKWPIQEDGTPVSALRLTQMKVE